MRFTMTIAFAAFAAAALAAQQSQPASSPAPSAQKGPVTVTGCLASGPNDTFTLTTPDRSAGGSSGEVPTSAGTTGSTATTPAGSKVVKTITYTLVPNGALDLKSNVGHQVQVSGAETPAETSTTTADRSNGAATPQGTSGVKPSVQTTAQAQIVVRQLRVDTIKSVADKCDILK